MNQRKITTRKCAIYGKGMTRPAALVLARQHNEFNSIQRCTSFPEMAAVAGGFFSPTSVGKEMMMERPTLQCQSIILPDIEYSNKSA